MDIDDDFLIAPHIKNRKSRQCSSRDKFLFRSRLEELKIYEYLLNLISSGIVNHRPIQILMLSAELLGRSSLISQLAQRGVKASEDRQNDFEDMVEKCSKRIVKTVLHDYVAPLIEKGLNRLTSRKTSSLVVRLKEVQKLFKLTDNEASILLLYYLISISAILSRFFIQSFDHGSNTNILNLSSIQILKSYGHYVLGISRQEVIKTFSNGNLIKTSLLELDEDDKSLVVCEWCRDYLSEANKQPLDHQFFKRETVSDLTPSDFEIGEDNYLVIKDLLKSKRRCNILFYGSAGTGKTSLAIALAAASRKELLSVKVHESDDIKKRMQAIYATMNIADRNRSIILVDEADELLNTYDSPFAQSLTNKSWANNLLETHNCKVIWITNRSTEIDPSTMRRFSFSMEFKALSSEQRLKVLSHEIRKNGLDSLFFDDELRGLCDNYNVDAGGIVNAATLFKSGKAGKKDIALRKIRAVLRNHEKATGMKKPADRSNNEYSLEGLNTSHKLQDVVSMVRQAIDLQKQGMPLTLLLYGKPGTGKSEFVHHLGRTLGIKVDMKRCSDIISMWVGETERKIAAAFREAEENGNVLFFDEADSFLFPRSSAVRSHEKSFTNELLAQLNSYRGIAIFATNDIEGLDHAALRRFMLKIVFHPLTPDGNLHFYRKLLLPLMDGSSNMPQQEVERLTAIANLTPGDFATVRRQFNFINAQDVTHERLISALAIESSHKQGTKKTIGFLPDIHKQRW